MHGGFWGDILGPTLLTGLGLGMTYVPLSMAVTADVDAEHTGVASALFTSANMIGGAVGLAVLSSVAAAHTKTLLGNGSDPLQALVDGFHRAFLLGAVLAVAALLVALAVLRVRRGSTAGTAPTNVAPIAEP